MQHIYYTILYYTILYYTILSIVLICNLQLQQWSFRCLNNNVTRNYSCVCLHNNITLILQQNAAVITATILLFKLLNDHSCDCRPQFELNKVLNHTRITILDIAQIHSQLHLLHLYKHRKPFVKVYIFIFYKCESGFMKKPL